MKTMFQQSKTATTLAQRDNVMPREEMMHVRTPIGAAKNTNLRYGNYTIVHVGFPQGSFKHREDVSHPMMDSMT